MAYDMCPGAAAGEKWRQLVSIPYLREPESATVSTCRADGLELLSLWRDNLAKVCRPLISGWGWPIALGLTRARIRPIIPPAAPEQSEETPKRGGAAQRHSF